MYMYPITRHIIAMLKVYISVTLFCKNYYFEFLKCETQILKFDNNCASDRLHYISK